MVNIADYDRPNTVAGLVAKHRELMTLREEIKKLTVDIDHLDAANLITGTISGVTFRSCMFAFSNHPP